MSYRILSDELNRVYAESGRAGSKATQWAPASFVWAVACSLWQQDNRDTLIPEKVLNHLKDKGIEVNLEEATQTLALHRLLSESIVTD